MLTVVSPKSDNVAVQPFAISVASEEEADTIVAETVAVCVFVLALTRETIDEEALKIWTLVLLFTAFVPAVIAEAKLLVAVCTSDKVANDPESRLAPVMVRLTDDQMAEAVSATKVPNEVKVRLLNDQIEAGSVVNRLEEAERTALLVLVLMTCAREVVATVRLSSTTVLIVLVETTDQSTIKLLSTITLSPLCTVPQIITDGQTPEMALLGVV